MSELVWYLCSTGGAVSALSVGGLWLWARPTSRHARRFLVASVLFYATASASGISHQFTRLIGAGFQPFQRADIPEGRTAIVILGSGSRTASDWDGREFSVVDPSGAQRVVEAARVFALVNPEWVISSGGMVYGGDTTPSTGVIMRDALVQLGVPAERIHADLRSRNTHEEAVAIARLLRLLKVEHTILVTSRVHMRRSIGTFRAEGVNAIPAIARDVGSRRTRPIDMLPSQNGLSETATSAHEVLGIGYYTLRGWHRF